jgi:molybdenum cofactor biosynthesis enzyme MoaA
MKEGVLLDPQAINRKMADAEAESYTQEELFEAPAASLEISARTIHTAYMALKAATARARTAQVQRVQVDQQLQREDITVEVYNKLYNQQEIDGIQAAAQMELAKIEVDRVNALTHFFEIDLLAQAGRQ